MAISGAISYPDLPGFRPKSVEGFSEQSTETLPVGVFDILRDSLIKEMSSWERFSERTVVVNAQNFRDALISFLLKDAFAKAPGLSQGTSDMIIVYTGVLGLVLSEVFRKLGRIEDIANAGITTLAGIAINHCSTTLALSDLQERRKRLEDLLIRDS